MNKTFKIALGAVLSLGLVMPAVAQDNFPDVPENHWAYEAVGRLKEAEVLFGYPDGLYRGNRPMSRYEFAVATFQFWKKVRGWYDNHEERLKALEGMDGGNIGELRDMVKQLRAEVDGMKGWGKRVEDLEKLSKEFEKELASLGVDVKKLQDDMGDLEGRVSRLEKIKPAVDIHGGVDFLVLAAHSTDKRFGITPSNRVLGQSTVGGIAGLTRDLTVLHEAAFNVKGTNEEGPKWDATIVAGNMLGNEAGAFGKTALGTFNSQNAGAGFGAGSGDFYINDAAVTFDTAMMGQGFTAKIGRVHHQVGPYLWKRSDFTTYFKNNRWDNGDFYFDGGILSFNFGAADLKVFGGVNSQIKSVNNVEISPIGGAVNPFVDKTLGVQLMFPVGDMGGINLAYLWHSSDQVVGGIDGLNVYGAELNLKFDNIGVFGAFSKADTKLGDNTVNDSDNTVFDVMLKYDGGSWGAGGGYREVENNFAAAGSWGRIGNQWSPRNVKGFRGNVWFTPSEALKVYAKGEFLEPKENTVGYAYTNLDKINAFTVGLDYQFGPNWGAMFSYEDVKFDAIVGGDPTQRWYTLGFNYGMSANSNLSFTYQFSDVDFKLNGAGLDPAGANRYKGGLLGTQLSIKF